MALLFCDGADHYTTAAQVLMKWTGGTSNATDSVGVGDGRFGTNSIHANGGSNGGELYKTGFGSPATIIVGLAMTHSTWVSLTILRLKQGGTVHVDVRTDSSGHAFVTRNGTQLGSIAADALTAGYHYFEIKTLIDDTVGTVELRVDGVAVVGPLTNQDTRNAASAFIDTLALIEIVGSAQIYDDVYICDTTGTSCNDFLGDIVVQTILPNGNGNYSQLIGSDADSTDNYLLVDETSPDDDTTYVESGTVAQKDTYAYGNLTALTGTVHAVVTYAWMKKTAAGTRQATTVARSGGTDEDGATATLGVSYGLYSDIRHTKPGGGAWSIADVNAAEFGVKVVA